MYTISRFMTEAVVRMLFAATLVSLLFIGCAHKGPLQGQEIIFFQSPASVSRNNQCILTIQGRVFEPTDKSSGREELITAGAPLVGANRTDPLYRERASYLLSDSKRNTSVSVKVGDQPHPLPASDAAGYFTGDVALPCNEVMQLAKDGKISFQSMPTPTNEKIFHGSVMLVPEDGVTVITDIDDTIKDTNVLNQEEMVKNTVSREFKAVDGMPDLYLSWMKALEPCIHFHVLSAGPWQLYEPLRQFTEKAGFPAFTWDMRSVDLPDLRGLKEMTSDPYKFKLPKIRAFMARFPKRHVVLVGDSGEKDPKVYEEILRLYPDRVDDIFIRNVGSKDPKDWNEMLCRYNKEPTAKIKVFQNPKDLPPLTRPTVCEGR